MNHWVVRPRNLWGDYGSVLISGYATIDTSDSRLLLQRTGPYLPPLSLPRFSGGGAAHIVSRDLFDVLASSGAADLQARPAIKDRIVPLPWHEWDLSSPVVSVYPRDGEPQAYIWDIEPDETAARDMTTPWELLPPFVDCRLKLKTAADGMYLDAFDGFGDFSNCPGLFANRNDYYKHLVVDDHVMEMIKSFAGEWVRFLPIDKH
jgi:hypothetical protein